MCCADFDTWTISAPDGGVVRPAAAASVHGLGGMLRHLVRLHPELVGKIGNTGYRRVIRAELKATHKQFFAYASDHNVSLKSVRLNNDHRAASVLAKLQRIRVTELKRQRDQEIGAVTQEQIAAAEEQLSERERELKAAEKALDDDSAADIEFRVDLAMIIGVLSDLDVTWYEWEHWDEAAHGGTARPEQEPCSGQASAFDDKSATELHSTMLQKAGGDPLYYVGDNGQVYPISGVGRFYIMPPFANSKDSTTIANELFLDCLLGAPGQHPHQAELRGQRAAQHGAARVGALDPVPDRQRPARCRHDGLLHTVQGEVYRGRHLRGDDGAADDDGTRRRRRRLRAHDTDAAAGQL